MTSIEPNSLTSMQGRNTILYVFDPSECVLMTAGSFSCSSKTLSSKIGSVVKLHTPCNILSGEERR